MNILVPHNWLKDYIETNATPQEIAWLLSLHAFSVEKIIEGKGGDLVYEIEITPNRGDALSVQGIARELRAILPRNGFKAEWRDQRVAAATDGQDELKLDVEIIDKTLVPRFSAIILDNVQIKSSPEIVQKRLEAVGTRALNNVIDITNYMMFDKGQPMHAFDYDKILGAKMIVRQSRQSEKIITLDGVERELSEGVIIIEDGAGRLIDLCGIMGAKNSEVDESTKRVLLFVQVYDPVRIRRASMALGHRTQAALRFEKGIDFEGVIPALWEAVDFLQKEAGAAVASKLIDIVNVKNESKKVAVDYEKINQVAGIEIKKEEVDKILLDLGFVFDGQDIIVPSWRYGDIAIAEDLAEEVVRLYGYEKLPDQLLAGNISQQAVDPVFKIEDKARVYLKHQGFFECYTNSATSKNLAGASAVKLANPLSEDNSYLKTSLVPQLLDILVKNQSYSDRVKIFELASVYLAREDNLPEQPMKLGLACRGISYLELKGTIEGLFEDLGIGDAPDFTIQKPEEDILTIELDFEMLSKQVGKNKTYTPISLFNSIKEDLTLVVPEDHNIRYQDIALLILAVDSRVKKIQFKDIYKNFLTLAIEYLDTEKQISSEQTQEIRGKIFKELEEKLNVRLKI